MGLLLLFGRELWRAFGRTIVSARDRARDDREARERIEAAMKTPGATAENPLEVTTASLVESVATTLPCVVCGEAVIAEDHSVDTTGAEPLRKVDVHCRRCGHRRPLYVRIVHERLH